MATDLIEFCMNFSLYFLVVNQMKDGQPNRIGRRVGPSSKKILNYTNQLLVCLHIDKTLLRVVVYNTKYYKFVLLNEVFGSLADC